MSKPRIGKIFKCLTCGKDCYFKPSQANKYKNHYCSRDCQHKGLNKGAKIKRVCEYCGREYKTYQSQIKLRGSKYCSNACKWLAYGEKMSGKNSRLWKGGISNKNKKIRAGAKFRLWREAVFKRDNWTCQKYGIKGGRLHPHHIQNFSQYSELRFAIDNGITLSEKAHIEFHKLYGFRNNTREQLDEFLNEKTTVN